MKRTTKKSLVFATAVAILFFAAPGVQAGGVHKIRTKKDPSTSNFSGTQPNKKLIAHKRRKSSKSKQAKDRSTSGFQMVTEKET